MNANVDTPNTISPEGTPFNDAGIVSFLVYGGEYRARLVDVRAKLASATKPKLIDEISGLWPELLTDGSWSKAGLRALSAFELAVILVQL